MTAQQVEALDKLIAAVEGGALVWRRMVLDCGIPLVETMQAYCNNSIDAAMALKDALVPGWIIRDWSQDLWRKGNLWGCVLVENDEEKLQCERHGLVVLYNDYDTPARALLLAVLMAYRAQIAQTQDL